MRLEFEAVEGRRIMAGGNHDPAHRGLCLDRVRNGRSRNRPIGQGHCKTIAGKYFCRAARKLIREKTPVVADDDFFSSVGDRVAAPEISRGLRDALDVSKSEILGNDRPPAIGPEFNFHLWINLGVKTKQ